MQYFIKMNKFELSELLDNFEKTNRHFVKRTDELLNSRKLLMYNICLFSPRLTLVPINKIRMFIDGTHYTNWLGHEHEEGNLVYVFYDLPVNIVYRSMRF